MHFYINACNTSWTCPDNLKSERKRILTTKQTDDTSDTDVGKQQLHINISS